MRRPKVAKLVHCPRLRAEVERRLGQRWSPQQIAARLAVDYPEDAEMRVSHEPIYQSLPQPAQEREVAAQPSLHRGCRLPCCAQARQNPLPAALRVELTRCLRTGRIHRRSRRRTAEGRGKLLDMVLISARPAEVADRAVPGHWEGDLVIGKAGHSAIGTLIERQTRFVLLLHLADGRLAEHVRTALATKILELPTQLRRSLTWDRGKEMAEHVRFTVDTGVQVYFCDPHSPWQRGANENMNGLLRQYFPKGADLSGYDAAQLDAVAAQLNARPRHTLGWLTPSEAFARAVAMTG